MLERAAAGELPAWMQASTRRREHMGRVAALMQEWGVALGLGHVDQLRWRATGWLHDVLRDAPAEELRPWLTGEFRTLPAGYLHGPATAARLLAEGVEDDELLDAIRFHTLGSERLGTLGRILIVADYLEPGRREKADWRAIQRARMPGQLHEVLREVVRAKLQRDLDDEEPMRHEMVRLWNSLTGDDKENGT